MTISSIHERLSECTAQIVVSEKSNGFGFFVAQNTLLTCNHVVSESEEPNLRVRWNNEELPVRMKIPYEETDLALLSVELGHHPCLPLNQDLVSFDTLYAQGCEPLLVKGFAGGIEKIVLEGGKGYIGKGHSGTPVFNSRTEGVCGFISSGGESEEEVHATNIKHALEILPELASIQSSPLNTIKIFIVHAQSDKALLDELIPLLKDANLPRLALYWKQDLPEDFAKADAVMEENYPMTFDVAQIIVLLVSSEHYNTDTYYKGYTQALPGKAQIIQVLPPNCAPVTGWSGRSVAFRDFTKSIREIAGTLNIADY